MFLCSNYTKLCSSSLGSTPLSAPRLRVVPDPEIPTCLSSRFIVNVDLVWDMSWVRCDGYFWSCEMVWYSWWCMMTVWVMVLSRHVLVWVIIMLCDMSIIYCIYVRCDMYYLGYWWYSCWVGCDTWSYDVGTCCGVWRPAGTGVCSLVTRMEYRIPLHHRQVDRAIGLGELKISGDIPSRHAIAWSVVS